MTPDRQPPRLADALLKRVLPIGKRGESILGDLREEFREMVRRDAPSGASAARRWYWQQAIRLTLRYFTQPAPGPQLDRSRRSPMLMDLTSDLRTAARMLRRNPGTSSLIVFTLALAIGASTIGFAFADLALFRGLPVDEPSEVVSMFGTDTHGANQRGLVSAPDFLDYRARTTTVTHMGAYRESSAPLIEDGRSRTLRVGWATAEFFTAMGQPAVQGRLFLDGEDTAGAPLVAVLSHRYWRDAMAGRAGAIGTPLQIGRDSYTIVGVLTPEMEWANLARIDVWLPMRLSPEMPRTTRNLRVVARLRDGQTRESAGAEFAAMSAALGTEHPDTNTGWRIRVVAARDMAGDANFWVVIALFLLSIGLLMAIATANVSNLVLARAASRQRELAVRTALGARRGRLVQQLVVEGLTLSIAGSVLAFPVAWAGLKAITLFSSNLVFQQLLIDSHELGFVAVLALVCPLMFSIAPARTLGRTDTRQLLAAGGVRGATATMRGRGVLVVAQLALAVILLTASSFALQSVRQIYTTPTGLQTDGLSFLTLDFNDVLYPSDLLARSAVAATRDGLAGLPGVEHVATTTALPILGSEGASPMTVEGAVLPAGEAPAAVTVTGTSADWGSTIGLTMLAGSWWANADSGVAVVSRSVAERRLGGVDAAVGKRVTLSHGAAPALVRVVGVSSDIVNGTLTDVSPRVWVPIDPATRRVTFVLKSRGDFASLTNGIRAAVASTAPAVPIEDLESLNEALVRAASSDYVVIGMLGAFAVLALVLAATGLFGVVSYAAAERTAEFGTRMALGARAWDVISLVLGQSMRLLAFGLGLGLAGGVGLSFMIRGLLYGTSPTDPVTLGGVALLLVAVTLAATALPAWRASRIDPVTALRAE
jgi:putative ABC transport system permease protein